MTALCVYTIVYNMYDDGWSGASFLLCIATTHDMSVHRTLHRCAALCCNPANRSIITCNAMCVRHHVSGN